MAEESKQDYSKISEPYNAFMERQLTQFGSTPTGLPVGETSDSSTTNDSSGSAVSNPGDVDPGSVSGQSFTNLFIENFIQSRSWQPKTRGFKLDGRTGYAEFSNIFVTGGGTLGGFDIGTDYIRDSANSFGLASTVTAGNDVRFWAGDTFANRATAEFIVYENGDVTAASITITGGSATNMSIASIPNSTATDISLLDLTHNIVFSVTDKDTVAWTLGTITLSNGRTFSIVAGDTDTRLTAAALTSPMNARTYIYLDTTLSSTILQATYTVSTAMGANKKLIATAQNQAAQATFTVYDGIGGLKLAASNTSISNNNWSFSGAWSVTDADTVAWGAGTFTTSDGGSYAITGSNTGNMGAKTYIYFDLGTSSTAFQTTTTASTAIGDGKILVAIAQNGTAEASFMVMNDKQINLDAANIVAGSITANELAVGSVTATRIDVSQLSAISADMGTITAGSIGVNLLTAGTITSKTITLAIAAGVGDTYIAAGKTDFNNTVTGFILGLDDSDSDLPKFYIGSSTAYFNWTGTAVDIVGATLTAGTIQTATSGQRISLSGSDNTLRFYDSVGQVIGIGSTAGSAIRLDLNATTTTGINVSASVASTMALYYKNTGNVTNKGIVLELTGATNDGIGLDINHDGSGGQGIFIDISAGAKGLYVSNTSTGNSIGILNASSSGIGIQLTNSGTGIGMQIANTGNGTGLDIDYDGTGIGLNIDSSNGSAGAGLKIVHVGTSNAGLLIDKNSAYISLEIDQNSNSASANTGLLMDVNNAGSGNSTGLYMAIYSTGGARYAFDFEGNEYNGTKTGVSDIIGVIQVNTVDGAGFIPIYGTAT
jgi:hypothetical protein